MRRHWLGCQRIDYEACGSTNDEAARLARAGAHHGTVVIAERQRNGRGRDGRVWESPLGGLYFSAVLRPPLPLLAVPPMTLAIGIGVCEAARAAGADAALKWPNDVFARGKKLAGVLVEAQSQGSRLEAVIVGIGVNLTGELPADVASRAITLEDASADTIEREAFISSLCMHVERWVDRYVASGLETIVPAWRARMAHGLVARAMVEGRELVGEVDGLDSDGALLLRDSDGKIHHVRSGDVEVLRAAQSVAQHATT